jgi:hypothetical protein
VETARSTLVDAGVAVSVVFLWPPDHRVEVAATLAGPAGPPPPADALENAGTLPTLVLVDNTPVDDARLSVTRVPKLVVAVEPQLRFHVSHTPSRSRN